MKPNRLQRAWAAAAALGMTAALLCFPEEVKAGTLGSIRYCLGVLAPSLFPFMVVTGFVTASGAGEALAGPLGPLARHAFKLPGCCGAPVLLGFLAGYPAGARGASLLLEEGKITERQAARMLLFCVSPGTAFVVTYLGGGVLHSFALGWRLFFSVTAAGLLLGVLTGLKEKAPPKGREINKKTEGGALVQAVSGAAHSVLTMCACIVAFAGFTAILHGTGVYQALVRAGAALGVLSPTETAVALSFLLEVTGGVGDAAQFHAGPALYAFGLGFGGLCVHLQVFAQFARFPVKKRWFLLCRALHGLLAAGCFLLLERLFPTAAAQPFVPVGAQPVQAFSGTVAGGLSLLLMCGAFLAAVGPSGQTPGPARKG